MVKFLSELKPYNIEGKTLYFNPGYINQLNVFKERIHRQYDNIFLITGMEGTGKSRGIAIPTAFYLSGHNIKVVFTFEQFEKAYSEMTSGGTIIWDEFIFSGMGADALSEMQKNLIKVMATGREHHLINVMLIIPSIFLLKNYFAVHRALCQIHTDSPDFLSRGYAYFYSFEDKRLLFNLNKKTQYCDLKMSSFGFSFDDCKEELYDMKEYARLKKEAIDSIGKDKDKKEKDEEPLDQKNAVKNLRIALPLVQKYKENGYTYEEICDIISKYYNKIIITPGALRKKVERDNKTKTKENVPKLTFNIDGQDTGDKIYC